MTGRVALEGKVIHIHDVLADPEYRVREYQQEFEFRTNLGVPLLRDGTTIGVFALVRNEVRPVHRKADRAGNDVRRPGSDRDRERAVVRGAGAAHARARPNRWSSRRRPPKCCRSSRSSPGDLQPVFASILENATRICEAKFGILVLPGRRRIPGRRHAQGPGGFVELRRREPVFLPDR